jgi:hypothetical protein
MWIERSNRNIRTLELQVNDTGDDFTLWMDFVTSLVGESWFYAKVLKDAHCGVTGALQVRNLEPLRPKEQLWLSKRPADDDEKVRLSVLDKQGNRIGELDERTSHEVLDASSAGRLWLACFNQLLHESDGSLTALIGLVQVAALPKWVVDLHGPKNVH